MLSYGHVLGTREPWDDRADGDLPFDSSYNIPGKLGDSFGIVESFPGYGHSFLGGPVIDILLWFTDFHHFFSPVSGKVVYSSNFMGTHQYDIDNFDPTFPFGKFDRVPYMLWLSALLDILLLHHSLHTN